LLVCGNSTPHSGDKVAAKNAQTWQIIICAANSWPLASVGQLEQQTGQRAYKQWLIVADCGHKLLNYWAVVELIDRRLCPSVDIKPICSPIYCVQMEFRVEFFFDSTGSFGTLFLFPHFR